MNTNYAKIAKNKSLLKEYSTSESSRTVYLNDGDEFQIQLFNPETTEVSARIWIEDTQLSHDIVLKPGERIWLERYTDRTKKFKFETYIVDGNDAQVKGAISHNGNIKIDFFKRRKVERPVTFYYEAPKWKPGYYDWNLYSTTCDNSFSLAGSINNYCDTVLSCDCAATGSVNANSTITASAAADNVNCFYTSTASNANFAKGTHFKDSISTVEPGCSSAVYNSDWYKDKKDLETGRVGDGGNSKQRFTSVDMDFEYWPFRTEVIKILPESRKPYTSNDLKKVYCSNCGRKLKDKYNFCPYCGAKID